VNFYCEAARDMKTKVQVRQTLPFLHAKSRSKKPYVTHYSEGTCRGFAWQGFGSGGAIQVASVKSCEKLPPCLIESTPASYKTDPLLAKAKPISDGGNASVITYLRGGKKLW